LRLDKVNSPLSIALRETYIESLQFLLFQEVILLVEVNLSVA
jgi:hypothetical protein